MDSESIISISSSSSESIEEATQCPHGDYPNHSGREWICSCKSGDKGHVLIEVDREKPRSVIRIRYDFDKTTTVTREQPMHPAKTPLLNHIKESQMRKNAAMNDSLRVESVEDLREEPKRNGNQKNGITSRDIVMINAQLMHTPLSPESQKKELYSYLQLMNPADRKEARRVFTNRRSNRVRNLVAEERNRQNEKNRQEEVKSRQGKERSEEENFSEERNMYLPLPPPECYQTIVDFEDTLDASGILNGSLRTVQSVHKDKKKMFKPDRYQFHTYRKSKMLRSNGRLRNIDLDKIITNKSNMRQRARRKLLKTKEKLKRSKDQIEKRTSIKLSPLEAVDVESTTNSTASPKLDIDERHRPVESDDENVDLTNFVDDMLELDMLSEEHKKSLIESRMFTTQSAKIVNLISKKSVKEDKVKRAYKIFSDITFGNRSSSTETTEKREPNRNSTEVHGIDSDHQYHCANGSDNVTTTNDLSERTEISTTTIKHYVKTIEHTDNSKKSSPPFDEAAKQQLEQQTTQQGSADATVISALKEKCSKTVSSRTTQRSQTSEQAPVAVLNGTSNKSPACISIEHNYSTPHHNLQYESSDSDDSADEDSIPEEEQHSAASLSPVPIPKLDVVPVNRAVPIKTLHRSLTFRKRRIVQNHADANSNMWMNDETPSEKKRRLNHSISLSSEDGSVLGAFYEDNRLVVSQKNVVSFWTQSALGNVLGAQDMWIPNGRIQRLVMNNKYVQKHSTDMVMSNEASVAYVELWTKEHKSDFRERPVSDVFAAVYFWRTRQKGLDKKVLQLENIKGFSDDVQYIVTKNAAKIIVSWHYKTEQEKKSHVHMYQLAADFQTVANISQIESVDHYISSLHNIEDSDSLLMACGENYITIWNTEYGYKVSTIHLSEIKMALSTLWVKCDRGFLFLVQECVDGELRLIAINGIDQTWKKLQNYVSPESFQSLKGVYMDNGFVLAFYTEGIICWNARTGENVVEEVATDIEYMPCGKYVIMIVDEQIVVRHALSHFITSDDF